MYKIYTNQMGMPQRYIYKLWLIMRLTTAIIIAAIMQVSAGGFAQQISLNTNKASLTSVIKEINKQTGYDFFYDKELLKKAKPISVNLVNVDLATALEKCFEGQPFQYKIENKSILLKEKSLSILNRITNAFGAIDIRGKISTEDGTPISGATVTVKGTKKSVATDQNGGFYISNIEEGAILIVSYVGYITKEVPASAVNNITLMIASSDLQEVVINKGYYNTTKQLNTGSVSTVNAASLSRQPVGDPLMALHGQVTGLYLAQEQGSPGAPITVTLRGRNSIANGNEPLYILDGVPFSSGYANNIPTGGTYTSPFSTIGMDNIESIDVLKDADATAIYGSRGANGVILITTKKGKAGKTTLNANFNRGFGRILKGYDLMNTEQYLAMRKEAFSNDGATPYDFSYDLNGTWDKSSYTDWEDLLIGGTALLTNTSASVSGGSDLVQYLVSGSYRNETTVYPGDYRNRKLSFQSNITSRSANNKFTSSFSVNLLNDDNLLPPFELTTQIVNSPNTPAIYNSDGTLNWANSSWYNPLASLLNKSTSSVENLNGSLNLNYNVLPGISISTRLGYNKISSETNNIFPASAKDPAYEITMYSRRNEQGVQSTSSWIAEPSINFNKTYTWGKVDGVLGATLQGTVIRGQSLVAFGYSSDALMEDLLSASNILAGSSNSSQYHYGAIYARLGYSYNDRYVLNLTTRRDGSSRFGPGKQFGNFGAIGAAWIFSSEDFIRDTFPFLNFGKLRTSYGVTGNDQLSDYMFLSTYTASGIPYQGLAGLNPTRHTNPEFGWETVKKMEAAIELSMLKNTLAINVNWYRNRTGNQLVGYPLPAMTGFNTVQANLPAVVQNSGIEVETTVTFLHQKKLNWSFSANLSIPENKLVSYPNLAASSYANRYIIGKPLFISQRYHYTGIDDQTGVYTFEDKNGDGSITSALDRSPVFVGQHWFGGMTNHFSFKGFELDVLLQYVKQTGFETQPMTTPGFFFGDQGNVPRRFTDRWKNSGDAATYQKYTQSFGSLAKVASTLYAESDRTIVDKSFIRLRNISLGWNMPDRFCKRIGIASLKVYAQGQNIFTVTGYDGPDPEMTATGYSLPPLRMITCGMQLSIN